MLGKKEVQVGSEQWSIVDFRIQAITGKSSIQMLNVYNYPNTKSEQYKNEGVLHVTDFDRDYIQKVARNALQTQEMIFYCGHVNIHTQIRPNKVFTFLLCRLNLGRIGTIKDQVSLADTIMLQNENDKDAFQYNFMINDQNKYKIEYEVHFTINNDKQFIQNDYECVNCQNKRAKVHCLNEALNLCEECSKDHHNRRMMNGHDIQKLDKINSLPICKKHSQKLKYYCSRCKKYLCAVCLQKGNSHGNADHPVADISQLYHDKREETQVVSARQREKLANLLRNLEIKKEQIEQNYQETKQIIENIFERSLNTLNKMHQEKSFLIKSDQIELRMMSQRLEWCKTFVRFQEKNLKPIFYFQSQEKFGQEIGKVRVSEFSSIFSLKADLAVEGDLSVGRRDQMEAPLRQAPIPSGNGELSETRKVELRALETKKTIYDYDSAAEAPLRGELSLMLENAQLNFFHVAR